MKSIAEEEILQAARRLKYQYCWDIIVGPGINLKDEATSKNNIPFSIQIFRGYNNVANTIRISAARTVLKAMGRAHLWRQYRGLDKSIAEETILQAAYVSILPRRHYCRPWYKPRRRRDKWKQYTFQHTSMPRVLQWCKHVLDICFEDSSAGQGENLPKKSIQRRR